MRALRLLALTAAVALTAARAEAAGSRMLGGFQSVAIEEGPRAIWINPAVLAFSGDAGLMAEGVFLETDDGYKDLSFLTVGAAAPGRAYGGQLEFDDIGGIADWTLAVSRVLGEGRRARLGTTLEWRGGDDKTFDAVIGAFMPLGRNLRVGGSVEDLLESDVDGESNQRSWRSGVGAYGHAGWLSWDWRGQEHETGHHIFGLGLDLRYLRLAGSYDPEGTWTAAARLVVGEHAAGVGATMPDEGFGSRFATVEFGAHPRTR